VLVVGIETSSRRGSVALVRDGRVLGRAEHERLNAHAEELQPLLERLLAEAGVSKHELTRVAVGMGPGSFTGLRVGIAFAQGIALGLGLEWIGVGSLKAMARTAPAKSSLPRVTLLDARRNEIFAAVHAADGSELRAPVVVPRDDLSSFLGSAPSPHLVLGEVSEALGIGDAFRSKLTDLPDATGVALLAEQMDPDRSITEPLYVRDAGATLPSLPPSPFDTDHVE
jgi:tRNA threonylcarbamoyladenosine biosynthesis protein TsaB